MFASEYSRFDALGLASLLYSGEVSAREVMACYERYDESLDVATRAKLQGAFGATPFLLKDAGLPARRFPSSIGSRLFKDLTFKFDATLVERFEGAGLIPFARTTVPELCMSPTTEAEVYEGPTRNPWNLACSAGGSSGGAAAAVAAGIVPIAHGNDGGGSIRTPAACCGVYGLKPSRGRVPMGPGRGEGWGGLAAEGVLSRTVRDTAAALDAMSGSEPGAPYAAPAAPHSYLSVLSQAFERPLRIGMWTTAWDDIEVDPECIFALKRAAPLIQAAGHEVFEVPVPELDYAGLIESHIQVLAANIVVSVNSVTRGRIIKDWQHKLEPAILDGYHLGRTLTAEQYIGAINAFHRIGRQLERHMADVDIILAPVLTRLPARLGEFTTRTDFRTFRRNVARYTTFLAITNASGQPAASVPLHWTESGLPVGVQLIGHFGREDQVLQLSAQLEAAAPWEARLATLYRPEANDAH
jgi:amidase